MPINIVVGADGRIKYTHFGAVTTPEQLSEQEDAIAHGIACGKWFVNDIPGGSILIFDIELLAVD